MELKAEGYYVARGLSFRLVPLPWVCRPQNFAELTLCAAR